MEREKEKQYHSFIVCTVYSVCVWISMYFLNYQHEILLSFLMIQIINTYYFLKLFNFFELVWNCNNDINPRARSLSFFFIHCLSIVCSHCLEIKWNQMESVSKTRKKRRRYLHSSFFNDWHNLFFGTTRFQNLLLQAHYLYPINMN